MHYGIDWAAPLGTPVYCAEAGHIRYKANEPGGYGNTLTAQHIDGWESRYAHLSTFLVNQGDPVHRGQVIAYTGGAAGAPGSGSSTGPHLHHELRQHGTAVDPYPLLVWGDTGPNPGDDVTKEEMDQLGAWMQEQAVLTQNIILGTLIGRGWPGNENVLGAWEQDTRAIVNAHTSAVCDPSSDAVEAAVNAEESAIPTEVESAVTE